MVFSILYLQFGQILNRACFNKWASNGCQYPKIKQLLQIQTFKTIKPMEDKLLKGTCNDQVYDPFESPPSLEKAQNHQKATSLGKQIESNGEQQVCPCCQNVIQKQPIPLNCEDQQLVFLGVGYPLYYKLTRYFGIIIFIIFMISGSGFYFLITLSCVQQCIYFFGIPTINLEIPGVISAQKTDILNVVTAFAIFGCVMYFKGKIREDIAVLDKKYVSVDQYTIIIQNLPENITEEDLIQFSKEKFGIKPILINFAYNINELSNAYKKRQVLTIKLNKLLIQQNSNGKFQYKIIPLHGQAKQIQQNIKSLDNLIDMYQQQKVICHKVGTAFLTYSEQKTVVGILNKYENSLLKKFINKLLSPFKVSSLIFRGEPVIIARAPSPREVIWENLSYSFLRSVLAEVLFVALMVLVLFFTFKIQSYIVAISYKMRHESAKSAETIVFIQALAMSLIVVVINALLRLLIKLFAFFKKYYSYSSYHSAFCLYYSISYIFNTCFIIYIVHGHRDNNQLLSLEQENVLIYDIHLIMLANAFSQPLFKIFDPEMWYRFLKRKYIATFPTHKNPYTQSYVNQAWEGYEIQIADNYQYIFRMLVITTWFAHSAPLGVVFSLIGMFIDYWIGKYLLLRYYKQPQSISRQIASPIIASLELLPLIYICGVLQFTYKVSNSQNIFEFLIQFLKYGITTFILAICILGYLIISKSSQEVGSPLKYDQVQASFAYNYQTENPITKFKGEMKYLYGVLKRGANLDDSKIIKELLMLDLKNKESYTQKQSKIVKIKRNTLKKLQVLDASQQYSYGTRKHSTDSDTSNQKSDFQKD